MFMSFQNVYVEALTPNMTAIGDGAFGRSSVRRGPVGSCCHDGIGILQGEQETEACFLHVRTQ